MYFKVFMQQWLKWRLRVVMSDRPDVIGVFMGFDRYMNLVLFDAQEVKYTHGEEHKRLLGLVVIRGENVTTFIPESPPTDTKKSELPVGTGQAHPHPASGGGLAV